MDHLRRQAKDLARRDVSCRLGAFAVQPHLALAQQLFQQHVSHMRIMPLEPAVQPRAVIVLSMVGKTYRLTQDMKDAAAALEPSAAGSVGCLDSQG